MPLLLKSRHPPIQKKGKGTVQASAYRNKLLKSYKRIRIGLYGENQSS
jgi:hypothetical protein